MTLDFGPQTIVTLLLMLGLAWIVGVRLGETAFGPRVSRWSTGGLMGVIFVIAIGLALVGRDPAPVVFALAMVPPIAIFSYFFRPGS